MLWHGLVRVCVVGRTFIAVVTKVLGPGQNFLGEPARGCGPPCTTRGLVLYHTLQRLQ